MHWQTSNDTAAISTQAEMETLPLVAQQKTSD
jgi:hypothetical protein